MTSTRLWDVDPIAQQVTVYRASAPEKPLTFRRGQAADAEPAVPGWRIPDEKIIT
jgi:hypothetical protein